MIGVKILQWSDSLMCVGPCRPRASCRTETDALHQFISHSHRILAAGAATLTHPAMVQWSETRGE